MPEPANRSAEKFPITDRVREALAVTLRGCDELLPEADWLARLARSQATGVPLRIKLGLDPTAPDIHLGHTVVLNKLRQLQDLGHTVIFLIGDFTATIGDPSGRNVTRPPLTREEIETNAQTYYRQAGLVLDLEKTEIAYNSKWSDPLGARGMIELASRYTVARIMERDDFTKRFKARTPISVHELLYPLMQGYDSVVLKSDLEIGGTDQKFNLLVGRALQSEYGQQPQCVLTMPLLEGLDGVEKMSKSKGNYVGISEAPNSMFGKLMSIDDPLMWRYFDLISLRPADEVDDMKHKCSLDMSQAGMNPRDAKLLLASEIVARFHGVPAAELAMDEFNRRRTGAAPADIESVSWKHEGQPLKLAFLLSKFGLCVSMAEARRVIASGGVKINGEKISDPEFAFTLPSEFLLQKGKIEFRRVCLVAAS